MKREREKEEEEEEEEEESSGSDEDFAQTEQRKKRSEESTTMSFWRVSRLLMNKNDDDTNARWKGGEKATKRFQTKKQDYSVW